MKPVVATGNKPHHFLPLIFPWKTYQTFVVHLQEMSKKMKVSPLQSLRKIDYSKDKIQTHPAKI